jgi:hypothetical protein
MVVLILLLDLSPGACKRKRFCKKKKGACIDIIPKKALRKYRKYKICSDYDVKTLGRCYKINGTCHMDESAQGRMICECVLPGRLS